MATSNSSAARSRSLSILSQTPLSELKTIHVAIKRNITTSGPSGPIERNIDDPKQLIPLVHFRKDAIRRGIFDRDDVVVNQEERSVSTEGIPDTRWSRNSVTYSRSLSGSPRRHSRSRSRSRTSNRRISERESSRRSLGKDRDREKSSERDKEQRLYKNRPYLREREDERHRRRSRTPLRPGEYRPSHSQSRRRSSSRDRSHVPEKYRSHSRISRSPTPDYQKPSTSKKPSRSPRRSRTSSRDRERPKSPPRHEPSKDRRSRSPVKSVKPYYSDKRPPGYKESDKRRSRSPSRYEREKRRSKSPRYHESSRSRSSPSRYEKRRRSRSSGFHESRRSPDNRCRSPHPPIVTFDRSRSTYKRSSRSPGYDRDRSYRRRRTRSRSPRKRRSRSPHRERELEYAYYEGIPGGEYWIPGPPIRPGFPAFPRYYPPALFPRMPGAPIIIPPRIPIVAPYPAPYRQRLPVYNSKQQPKVINPGQSANDGTVSTTTKAEEEGSASTSRVVEGVTIQEVSESEKGKKDADEELKDDQGDG